MLFYFSTILINEITHDNEVNILQFVFIHIFTFFDRIDFQIGVPKISYVHIYTYIKVLFFVTENYP